MIRRTTILFQQIDIAIYLPVGDRLLSTYIGNSEYGMFDITMQNLADYFLYILLWFDLISGIFSNPKILHEENSISLKNDSRKIKVSTSLTRLY